MHADAGEYVGATVRSCLSTTTVGIHSADARHYLLGGDSGQKAGVRSDAEEACRFDKGTLGFLGICDSFSFFSEKLKTLNSS